MPITPDDMPDMDDDNMSAQPRPVRPNGGRRPAARMANAGQDGSQDIDDSDADIDDALEEDELEADEAAPQSFSEIVRQSPIGAVIGAFVVGFLVSRLI